MYIKKSNCPSTEPRLVPQLQYSPNSNTVHQYLVFVVFLTNNS